MITSTETHQIWNKCAIGKHNPKAVLLGSEVICDFDSEEKAAKFTKLLNSFLTAAYTAIDNS